MDVSSPLEKSVSEDLERLHDLNRLSLNDLGDGPTQSLYNEDDQKLESNIPSVSPSDKIDTTNLEKEDAPEEPYKTESTTSNCDEFSNAYSEGEEEDEFDEFTAAVLKESGYDAKKPVILPIPLPPALNLISAMKGSREKRGTPPEKLAVTWAPDVYDPPPTAPSHVATNKKQRNKSETKKGAKSKQKGGGKPTKGKERDKKQFRKHGGGSSNRGYKSLDDDEDDVPYSDLGGFDVGSPDSYCGSSFLRKSVGKTHLPVAEAT